MAASVTETGEETAVGWRKSGRPAVDLTKWKVLGVTDTREFDLDTGKPIPGTGEDFDCEHCGRAIEIHVRLVALDGSGAEMTVGTGCLGRGIGEKYARQARAALEWQVKQAKNALRSPWFQTYSGVKHSEQATTEAKMVRDGSWRALAMLDAYKAKRRLNEAAVIRYLNGERAALNAAFYS